jgi:hypothetical protein
MDKPIYVTVEEFYGLVSVVKQTLENVDKLSKDVKTLTIGLKTLMEDVYEDGGTNAKA